MTAPLSLMAIRWSLMARRHGDFEKCVLWTAWSTLLVSDWASHADLYLNTGVETLLRYFNLSCCAVRTRTLDDVAGFSGVQVLRS